jgi:hypothetical protein
MEAELCEMTVLADIPVELAFHQVLSDLHVPPESVQRDLLNPPEAGETPSGLSAPSACPEPVEWAALR